MFIYESHIPTSYMVIIYGNDHIRLSYTVIIYGIIICRQSYTVTIIYGNHIRKHDIRESYTV